MPFSFLNSMPEVLRSLTESGYVKPTPIQSEAIPRILEGKDLLASAQTGSGKTAAFLLPALHKIKTAASSQSIGPKVLVLVPTRELAMQVATQAKKYSKYLSRVTTVCLYGGAPYPVQNRQLSRPYEILVATPGRLIDHMERGRIDFSQVGLFILDEADRMLDMGFVKSVEQVAAKLPEKVQTVMFSATFGKAILKLAGSLLKDPCRINLVEAKKHENIKQTLYFADDLHHKLRLLDHLLTRDTSQQTIVFTATKFFAEELCEKLEEKGYSVGVLHGDLQQRRRTSTIKKLREGKIAVLVATDVAARGIDIPTINYVINFDLPANIEDYVHRIGRTGRAEAKGEALSFVLPREHYLVEKISSLTNNEAAILSVPGLEPKAKEPKKSGAGGFSGKRKPQGDGRRPKPMNSRSSRNGRKQFSKARRG